MSRAFRFGPAHGLVAGVLITGLIFWMRGSSPPHGPRTEPLQARHVPEDASSALRVIGIHYAPAADSMALGVWKQLFAVLEPKVQVEVAVTRREDFDRLMAHLRGASTPHLERFHPVEVGAAITTWSRDRFAAFERPDGTGGILAPPRIDEAYVGRAGDWNAPFAFARAVFGVEPVMASFVFEGGDLVSTPEHLFVDANLGLRNLGRRSASREQIVAALGGVFSQQVVWLGDTAGEVPQHHAMMYMVPLDERRVAVGDLRRGLDLLRDEPRGAALELTPEPDLHAARFDRAASLLGARGFEVVRFPVVVLKGGGSYVTYTNALFDRTADDRPLVYLPTYSLPRLDEEAQRLYQQLGYEVRPVDVSSIYQQNGSLGCLVNVMSRTAPRMGYNTAN